MDFHFIVTRIKCLFLNTVETWATIQEEQFSKSQIYLKYAVPLIAIPTVCKFIGLSLVGYRVPFQNKIIRISLSDGIREATFSYVGYLIILIALSYIVQHILTKLDANITKEETSKLVVYSATPLLVSGVFFIIPAFAQLAVFGALFSIFVLYHGLVVFARELEEKILTATIMIVVSSLLMWLVLEIFLDELIRVYSTF